MEKFYFFFLTLLPYCCSFAGDIEVFLKTSVKRPIVANTYPLPLFPPGPPSSPSLPLLPTSFVHCFPFRLYSHHSIFNSSFLLYQSPLPDYFQSSVFLQLPLPSIPFHLLLQHARRRRRRR